MRSFFGLDVTEPVRDRLWELARPLRSLSSLKVVESKNYHVTVKFLGEISQRQRGDLDSGLQRMLPPVGPLHLNVRQLGTFPDLQNPSVVWAGIEPSDSLLTVFEAVEKVATGLGFDPEDRDFHPHITLARVKDGKRQRKELIEWIQTRGNRDITEFQVNELTLFESVLNPEGPEYTRLESWPL